MPPLRRSEGDERTIEKTHEGRTSGERGATTRSHSFRGSYVDLPFRSGLKDGAAVVTLGANDVVLGHAHRLSRNLVDLAGRKPLVLRVLRHSIDRYAGSDVQTGERTATGEEMRAPAWVIGVLVGSATVVAIWSGLNIWLDGQVLDTDQWTESSVEARERRSARSALCLLGE